MASQIFSQIDARKIGDDANAIFKADARQFGDDAVLRLQKLPLSDARRGQVRAEIEDLLTAPSEASARFFSTKAAEAGKSAATAIIEQERERLLRSKAKAIQETQSTRLAEAKKLLVATDTAKLVAVTTAVASEIIDAAQTAGDRNTTVEVTALLAGRAAEIDTVSKQSAFSAERTAAVELQGKIDGVFEKLKTALASEAKQNQVDNENAEAARIAREKLQKKAFDEDAPRRLREAVREQFQRQGFNLCAGAVNGDYIPLQNEPVATPELCAARCARVLGCDGFTAFQYGNEYNCRVYRNARRSADGGTLFGAMRRSCG